MKIAGCCDAEIGTPSIYFGRPFIDNPETFSLLAELALGLAGFTGIAAAFGGTARTYEHSDHLRLVGILVAPGRDFLDTVHVRTLPVRAHADGALMNQHWQPDKSGQQGCFKQGPSSRRHCFKRYAS